jgi:hypothetical protein
MDNLTWVRQLIEDVGIDQSEPKRLQTDVHLGHDPDWLRGYANGAHDDR